MAEDSKNEEIMVPADADAESAEAARARPKAARKAGAAKDQSAELDEQMLFETYDTKGIAVSDQSLEAYVKLRKTAYPNMFGRRRHLSYYNAHLDIVERFMNKLMRGGTGKKVSGKVIRRKGSLQGKKLKVLHVIEEAFVIIRERTGKNPVQLLIDAVQNAAPIEDTTRVRYGGISYNVAVGISSQRRLDVALRNLAMAALISSFKNRKTLAEAVASEITLAAANSADSYAIKKRVESERIAKRAR